MHQCHSNDFSQDAILMKRVNIIMTVYTFPEAKAETETELLKNYPILLSAPI